MYCIVVLIFSTQPVPGMIQFRTLTLTMVLIVPLRKRVLAAYCCILLYGDMLINAYTSCYRHRCVAIAVCCVCVPLAPLRGMAWRGLVWSGLVSSATCSWGIMLTAGSFLARCCFTSSRSRWPTLTTSTSSGATTSAEASPPTSVSRYEYIPLSCYFFFFTSSF